MNAARMMLLAQPSRPPASVLGLFGNGEKGGLWLPALTKSLFQDASMSIPAVVGMPVVKMLDLSGNGAHITFTDVTLQQDAAGKKYLAFNGTSSAGSTAAIDFTATDKMTLCAGVHKATNATAVQVELSTGFDSVGAGGLILYNEVHVDADSWVLGASGSTSGTAYAKATTYVAPITNVISGTFDLGQAALPEEITPRVNGVAPTRVDIGGGCVGTFGNYQLYIGARAGTSLFFNGRLYGLILRGAASTAGQIDDAERYLARLTGVSL